MFNIRLARPSDRDALYQICLETADSGQDGTHMYSDPELIGHIYAGPYLEFEPGFAFVLEDEQGVCGYVIGALDSQKFDEVLEREWWPALREKYADPGPQTAGKRTPDQSAAYLIHHPHGTPDELMAQYPSHLHIDLLPRGQGGGNGKRLLFTLFDALRAAGSPGVHLGVGGKNTNAQGFYKHVGFEELKRYPDGGATLGWKLKSF